MNKSRTSGDPAPHGEGIPIVISGPAGVGKTVVSRRLTSQQDDVVYSVSATSRDMRAGEVAGRDYVFLGREEFARRIEAGEFIEYTERLGRFYGTLRAPLEEHLRAGRDVVMDLDVHGAAAMRRHFPDGLFIYLLPPSQDLLVKRLKGRGRDPEEEIKQRLELDLSEARHILQYDYVTVNWDIEETVENVRTIMRADRFRLERSLRTLIELGCVPPQVGEMLDER